MAALAARSTAQTVGGVVPGDVHPSLIGGTGTPTLASADEVVARLLSFDRDGDGKVQKAELAERMHAMLNRADGNGDGALDAAEVRRLAVSPQRPTETRGFGRGMS